MTHPTPNFFVAMASHSCVSNGMDQRPPEEKDPKDSGRSFNIGAVTWAIIVVLVIIAVAWVVTS